MVDGRYSDSSVNFGKQKSWCRHLHKLWGNRRHYTFASMHVQIDAVAVASTHTHTKENTIVDIFRNSHKQLEMMQQNQSCNFGPVPGHCQIILGSENNCTSFDCALFFAPSLTPIYERTRSRVAHLSREKLLHIVRIALNLFGMQAQAICWACIFHIPSHLNRHFILLVATFFLLCCRMRQNNFSNTKMRMCVRITPSALLHVVDIFHYIRN